MEKNKIKVDILKVKKLLKLSEIVEQLKGLAKEKAFCYTELS